MPRPLLFNTAVQICELMYSRETSRCQRALLRLHNLTLQHAVQCVDMFYSPKSISKEKMFGSYYHSLSVHAPIVYRLVALRSVNSELQERMFNTCNDITLTTSNRHTSGILNNILIRVQSEAKVVNTTLQRHDGEVRSLASSLKPFTNTQFTATWINNHQNIWQAHLERISDFLLCGPGIWWKDHGNHVEFFDGPDEVNHKEQGPTLHHFRSSNLKDIETHLLACWEKCINEKVSIPINTTRIYSSSGELVSLSTIECDSQQSSGDQNAMKVNVHPETCTTDYDNITLDSQNPHPTNPMPPDTVKPPTTLQSVEHTGVDNTDPDEHNTDPDEHNTDLDEHNTDPDEHNTVLNNEDPSTTVELQEIPDDFTTELPNVHACTPSSSSQYEPKTQLGKQVMRLIPDKRLAQKFDKLRLAAKDCQREDRTQKRYERTAINVKQALLKRVQTS